MPKSKASKRKFHEAYETAFYTAGESGGRRRGRKGRGRKDDDLEEGVLVVITAVISIAVTVLIFSLILCCCRKRRRDDTVAETEFANGNVTPVQSQPLADNSVSITAPNVMAPGDKGNADNVYND